MAIEINKFLLQLKSLSIETDKKRIKTKDQMINGDELQATFHQNNRNLIGFLSVKERTHVNRIILTFKIVKPSQFLFFRNGFQSWSPSMEVKGTERFPKSWFPALKLHCYDPAEFIREEKESYLSHFFTYLRNDEEFLYLIPLDNSITLNHFLYQPEDKILKLIVEIDKEIEGDFKFLNLIWSNSFQVSSTPKQPEKTTTWCSWYYYYTRITDEIILKNLNLLDLLPIKLDYFQIDDGWEKNIGDWYENEKFKGGLLELVNKIKDKNVKPGIWMAPFVVEKKSSLLKNKKDWILKDSKGRFKIAGFNPLWSGFFYALDPTHPEVIAYLQDRIGYLKNCGFELFKFDFLYSLCIKGSHFMKNLSRREIFDAGMRILRESVGEEKLLGCGAPLILSDNFYDILRIGPDISNKWIDPLGKILGFEGMVSAFNCLQNTLTRHFLNGHFFLNDPDVAILRDSSLLKEQKRTLIISNYFLAPYFSFSDPIDLITHDSLSLLKKLQDYRDFTLTDGRFHTKIFHFKGYSNVGEVSGWINIFPTIGKIIREEGFNEIFGDKNSDTLLPFETRLFIKQ